MSLARLPMCANLINESFTDYSLVDLGCRTMALKPMLQGCREYYGTDLFPADGVIECNLEHGIPQLDDNSFDIVVALDVLEHLENAHLCLKEAMRIARKAVIVSLPNMYYIKFRVNFLKGQLSGKYRFPENPVLDRHRWVLSYEEADNFIRKNSQDHTVTARKIIPQRGRSKAILTPIERFLADMNPNMFAYGSLHMIQLNKG